MQSSGTTSTATRAPRAHGAQRARVDPALSAMDSLRRMVRALRVFSHAVRDERRVSGAQLFVMQCVAEEPGMSLKELARRTLTDPSSVSVVVSRLVESGAIKRRAAHDDARRSHLELTSRGRAIVRGAPQAVQSRMIHGLESLAPHEQRCVARALAKLVVHMGAEGEAPTMFFESEPLRRRAESRRSSARARGSRGRRVRA